MCTFLSKYRGKNRKFVLLHLIIKYIFIQILEKTNDFSFDFNIIIEFYEFTQTHLMGLPDAF